MAEFGDVDFILELPRNAEFDSLQFNVQFKTIKGANAALRASEERKGIRFLSTIVYIKRHRPSRIK